jgi:threonylcarbamoyladenosine tRNA methylthiotransferase MtaB
LEDIAGIVRIRISSIEDGRLALGLAKLMRPRHKVCRFLHIPVQSGCDRILKRMGRKYFTRDFATLVRDLVRDAPGIMIGTDVIVGFPGETDKDSEETLRFLRDLPVHYCHVFSYSHRQRARSRKFKGEVPLKVITQRSRVLRSLSDEKRITFLRTLLGIRQRVLFEQRKNNFWIGHTDNYVTIKTTSEYDLSNAFADVVPDKIEGHSLVARMISRG